VTLVACIAPAIGFACRLRDIGRPWCYMIEPLEEPLIAMDQVGGTHPVKHALTELVNLLIQTSESVRHV
jgi:hypothetical protein